MIKNHIIYINYNTQNVLFKCLVYYIVFYGRHYLEILCSKLKHSYIPTKNLFNGVTDEYHILALFIFN